MALPVRGLSEERPFLGGKGLFHCRRCSCKTVKDNPRRKNSYRARDTGLNDEVNTFISCGTNI